MSSLNSVGRSKGEKRGSPEAELMPVPMIFLLFQDGDEFLVIFNRKKVFTLGVVRNDNAKFHTF